MRFQLLSLLALAAAHGAHNEEDKDPNEPWQNRHMRLEHGIDTFDPLSFFTLHDSDKSKTWTRDDIINLYGLQGSIAHGDGTGSEKGSEPGQITDETRNMVVKEILKLLDTDNDGVVSLDEWRKFCMDNRVLPDFGLGTGHHGDYEYEYEVHHWRKYHQENDPDVLIVHPEDEEHERLYHSIEHGDEVGDDDKFAVMVQRIPQKYRKE